MYTVGQFSRIARVSAKTLRWYDEIGLFKPASVGEENQYRYYAPSQVRTFELILFLRELGVGLEDIRRVLDEGSGPEAFRDALERQAEAVRAQIETGRTRLDRIEAALRALREDYALPDAGLDVTVKDVPPLAAVAVRRRTSLREFPQVLNEAFSRLRSAPAGPPLSRYFDEDFDPENFEVEVLIPVARGGDVTLPGTRVASHLHVGEYGRLGEAYEAVFRFLTGAGVGRLAASGPVREVYLVGPGSGRKPEEYVTEIQVPLT